MLHLHVEQWLEASHIQHWLEAMQQDYVCFPTSPLHIMCVIWLEAGLASVLNVCCSCGAGCCCCCSCCCSCSRFCCTSKRRPCKEAGCCAVGGGGGGAFPPCRPSVCGGGGGAFHVVGGADIGGGVDGVVGSHAVRWGVLLPLSMAGEDWICRGIGLGLSLIHI